MQLNKASRYAGGLAAVVLLALLAVHQGVLRSTSMPPPEVQGQSFSVADDNPTTASGVHPADILGIGGRPLISCLDLGLVCTDPVSGDQDDLVALSFGWDFLTSDLPSLQFSVDAGSTGHGGTAVQTEATCSPAEPEADVFELATGRTNLQDLDGDGVACGSNSGYGLNLTEGAVSDNVDSLERDPCQFVDMACDGSPDEPIFLALAPGSPSLDAFGVTSADILVTGIDYAPLVWADGATDLGLESGDSIDAICLWENGNGIFDHGDQLLFSLTANSPSLSISGASPGDLLRPGPRVFFTARALGLLPGDDLDALLCAGDLRFHDVYLPVVVKD